MMRIFITAGTTAAVTIAQIISPFAYAMLDQAHGLVVIPIVIFIYNISIKLFTLNVVCALISFYIENLKARFYYISISTTIALVLIHLPMEDKWSDAIFSPYGWLIISLDLIVFVGALSIGYFVPTRA